MSLFIQVPVSTEVTQLNGDCTFDGKYQDGALVITVDTRDQNTHQRLGLSTRTKLCWGRENTYDVQELSALAWPIRYRVLCREGYYIDNAGERVHFTTGAHGLDARRGVSHVLMRAAVLLVVIAGIGYRRAAWLLQMLFHVQTSKSAVHRWIEEVADSLPSRREMIRALDGKARITECHFDELFPRGSSRCVLVLKDEHGRLVAMQEVDRRDEETVKTFLSRIKEIGLNLGAFYIDGCKAYYNAIRTVFGPQVAIQYDYFHILQNIWRKLWKWAVARRREHKARSEEASTPWQCKKLKALAKSLWDNRYLLFKADERMNEEEKQRLVQIVEADAEIGRLRAFLGGVWDIFRNSADEKEAKEALARLKLMPVDQRAPGPFEKSIQFIEGNFEWMTAFLRHEGVRRNSLAESGMRVLRRLEVEHDGFRSHDGRQNCLKIYQAVKYLGWRVHELSPDEPL